MSGAIAGVGFGLLLLRAVIGAVAFAVIGAGVSLVVARYLPELKKLSDADSAADSARAEGRNVDIVIPEEPAFDFDGGDEGEEGGGQAGPGHRGRGEDDGEFEGDPPAATPSIGRSAGPTEEDPFAPDALVEEVEELSSDDGAPGATGESHRESSTSRAGGRGSESADVVTEEESRELLDTDVENLPDIGGLAGNFDGETVESGANPAGGGDGESSVRDDMDPETIARALRTVLKRDQS
ncbi:hypothetical protein [Salinispira pacifica]